MTYLVATFPLRTLDPFLSPGLGPVPAIHCVCSVHVYYVNGYIRNMNRKGLSSSRDHFHRGGRESGKWMGVPNACFVAHN